MKRTAQFSLHAFAGTGPLRLLLAVLLATAPLLSIAQAMPLVLAIGAAVHGPIEQPPAAVHGSTMPCHDVAQATLDHAEAAGTFTAMADCPHCTGDASASACQCCSHAAPAGLAVPLIDTRTDSVHADDYAALLPDRVPPPCNERLYRPPIQFS